MPFQSINARQVPLPPKPPQEVREKFVALESIDVSENATNLSAGDSSQDNKLNSDSEDGLDESQLLESDQVVTPPSASVKRPGSNSRSSFGRQSADSKRSHNRAYQTLHTGSKIKHLKKKDGEPLWRVDIQYDFLAYIFHNELEVFTHGYKKTKGHTFADIYIDAMARSSKTSKVLCEKLLGDRKAGLNMAMVCLLVNIGRMNTTLNCKYYHSHDFFTLLISSLP